MSLGQLQEDGAPLAEFARLYFEKHRELDPLELDVHVGVYMAFDADGRRPKEVRAKGGARSYAFRYYLLVDKAPLPFKPAPGQEGEDRPDWAFAPADYKPVHDAEDASIEWLLHLPNKGDAVHDDDDELLRSDAPLFMQNLGKLSQELRLELYGGHLDDVRERPEGVAAKYEQEFVRSLARDFTYDDQGFYFEKWSGDHRPQPSRRYEALSDAYMKRWFEEILLLEGKFHLWVTTPGKGGTMFHFEPGEGAFERRHYTGRLPAELFREHEVLTDARREAAGAGKDEPARQRAVFFYSRDGVKDRWKARTPRVFSLDKDSRASRMVVDPRKLVQDANAGTEIAGLLGLGDDFDWFVELVAEKFPWRFYTFDLRDFDRRWQGGEPADRKPHYLREPLARAAREALAKAGGGRLAARARADVERWLDDPNLLLFPQGLESGGGTKFVGFADSLAYLRNLKTGHLEVMAADDYVMAMSMGKFYGEIARSTAWIVPVATFMAHAAMFAVSFGTSAGGMTLGQLSAQGVRGWLVRKGTREALNKAVWEAAKRLGPAFAALLAQALLGLFDDEAKKDQLSDRWRRFAKGFFEGYVIQTVYDHLFKKITTTLVDGPKEYRTIVAVRRVYGVLDRVQVIFRRLDDELDDAATKRAVDHFQRMVTHLVRGCGLLLGAVYHLPHDEAAPALELLGRGPDGEPPSLDQWEVEAGAAVASASRAFADGLGSLDDAGDLVVDALGAAKHLTLAGGVLYALSALKVTKWIRKAPGGKKEAKPRKKLFLFTSIAAVGLLAGLKRDDIPGLIDDIGELLKDVAEAARDFALGFPGRTEEEAELYGKLVGNLLGGFVLDRELGALRKKLDDHADTAASRAERGGAAVGGAMLWKNLKHGVVMPMIKLVFRRYLSLHDRLNRDVFGASKGHGALAAALSDVERRELEARGLGHLLEFEGEREKGMSLKSLGMMAMKLHRVVEEDTASFLQAKYAGQVQLYKDDLKAMAALSDDIGLTGFVEANLDVAWHHLATQLRLGLGELVEGLRLMFTPFRDGGHFSWITLLQELGLDVGNLNALRAELLEPRRAELAAIGLGAAPAPSPPVGS